mmetsp:Transcript_2194/g.3171  ORF Transcript_2194/g.3171 Transcript_2194/m.3171 type:complete len:389 (+) Transcript_2194:165-1331(+)
MIALMQEADTRRHFPQRRQSVGHIPPPVVVSNSQNHVPLDNTNWIEHLKGDVAHAEPNWEEQCSDQLPITHRSQRRRSMGDSPIFLNSQNLLSSQLDGWLSQLEKGDSNQFDNNFNPSTCTSGPTKLGINKGSEEKVQPKKKTGKQQKKVRSDYSDLWNLNYQKLGQFRQKNNHCVVPCEYNEDPSLARWVKRQRHLYHLLLKGKKSSLRPDRVKLLNDIGFSWDAKDALWQERYKNLVEFKNEHGHCVVPTIFAENQRLATWVKFQRRQYKLHLAGRPSYMTPGRIESLNSLGFEWTLRSSQTSKPAISIDTKDQKCWIDIMADLASDDEDDGDCSGEPVETLMADLFPEDGEPNSNQSGNANDDCFSDSKNLQKLLDEFSSDINDV